MPAGSLDAARPLAAPFAGQDPHRCEPTLYGVATTAGSVTSHALTPDASGAVASTDGGRQWRRGRAR
jgi:hypothetical protein